MQWRLQIHHICVLNNLICSTFKFGTGKNLCYIISYSLYFNILTNYPYISPKLFANFTDKSPIITHWLNFFKKFNILLKNGVGLGAGRRAPWQTTRRYFQFDKCKSFGITLDLLHYWSNEEEGYKNGDFILTLKGKTSPASLLSVY